VSELFDEVDEEMRRERLKKLWDRYSVLIISAVVLIIAGVGGWRGYDYLETKKAQEAGAAFEAAVTLSEENKSAEAEAAFNKIAAEAPKGYRTLARLRAAAESAKRDPKAAAQLFDAVAADASVGVAEQDLAKVRAAGLLMESLSFADMMQRLQPAAAAGRTYRHTARELLALSAWRNNDTAATRQWLDAITADAQTPPSMRSRAEALQALLPAVAKS